MKIKSTHPPSQGEFVVINDEDFDPARHEPYDEPVAVMPKPRKSKTEATPGVEP